MKSILRIIFDRLLKFYYAEPMGWLRVVYRSLRIAFLNLIALLILFSLFIISPFKRVKICPLHTRFPHFVADTDIFLRTLKLEGDSKRKVFYLGISTRPVNRRIFMMYKRIFPIIESPLLFETTKCTITKKSPFYHELPVVDSGKFYYFEDTRPLLSFTDSEEKEGRALLKEMGMEVDSWFICFYTRDSAYHIKEWDWRYGQRVDYNPTDLSFQDFRDSDIRTYLKAAGYITSMGGYAVRMGAAVTEKLPDSENPRIIDYSWNYRTEFGDIYLPAKCRFFLGGTSGLWAVPVVFNVPVACPNFIRFNKINFRQGALITPKKVWSIKEERFLTLREMLQTEVADYYLNEQYENAGLRVVDNTPEEILDLAKEMNERLDGIFETTEEDEELQRRFLAMFPKHLDSYGAPIRMGTMFLRKNRELLE